MGFGNHGNKRYTCDVVTKSERVGQIGVAPWRLVFSSLCCELWGDETL